MSRNLAPMPTVLDENLWASGHDEIESKLQVNFIFFFLMDQLVAQNVYTLICNVASVIDNSIILSVFFFLLNKQLLPILSA